MFAYIIFSTTFVNISFNDSFWLIDNGNGGFVGRIVKENFYSLTILIENQYVVFSLLLLSVVFFILSLNLKIKEILKILSLPYFVIKKIFEIKLLIFLDEISVKPQLNRFRTTNKEINPIV